MSFGVYREADLAAIEGTVPGGERYPALAIAHLDGEKGGCEACLADVASAETSDGSGRQKREGRLLRAHAPARRRTGPPRRGR